MSSSIVIPTPVVAQSAESFDQSIGVNVHMWETGSSYTNVALVESDLAYLGVDNIRDILEPVSQDLQALEALASAGYKFDFIIPPASTDIPTFVSLLDSFIASYPGSVIAIEGPNEVDIWPVQYDGGSALSNAAQYQEALYAAIRADANLTGIPVYNLTLGNVSATEYAAVGNLSSAANDANIHLYANDAYGPQWSFNIVLPYAQLDAPGLPTVITETGYETNPADGYSGVDQTVQAKYTLDTLMDAFKDGVAQTYLYELLDEGGTDWGLFNSDGTPKLAATAVHNLTTILADPGSTSSFTPGSLSYAIANLPANGNQFLLEKSTGAFDLAIWAEASIWNPTTETEIVAPTETSTVEFGQTQQVVLVFDPLQGTTPIAAYLNIQSVQVTLTDHPIIVEIASTTATLGTPTLTGFSPAGVGDDITLTGTALANGTVLVFDNATQIGTATANANGAWSFTTGTLAGGANAFTGMAVDGSGDVSALSTALNVNINTAASATVPIVSSLAESPSSGDLDAGKTVTLTLNLSEVVMVAGGTPTLTLDDGGAATYSGGSGTSALTFSYTVAAGQNAPALTATAVNLNSATITDGAGNAANLSLSGLTQSGPQIDTSAPAAPVITGDTVNGSNTVTLSGTAEANSTVTVYDNQTDVGTTTANAGGAWTYTTGTLANGTQALTATATDAAGNISAASNAVDPTISAPASSQPTHGNGHHAQPDNHHAAQVNLVEPTITDGTGTIDSLTTAATIDSATTPLDTTAPDALAITNEPLYEVNSTTSNVTVGSDGAPPQSDVQPKLEATTSNNSWSQAHATSPFSDISTSSAAINDNAEAAAGVIVLTPPASGRARTNSGSAWPHQGPIKLIDAATLDAIFGTTHTTPSGHLSDPAMPASIINQQISPDSTSAADHYDSAFHSDASASIPTGILTESTGSRPSRILGNSETHSEADLTRHSTLGHSAVHSALVVTATDVPLVPLGESADGNPLQTLKGLLTAITQALAHAHSDIHDAPAFAPSVAGLVAAGADSFIFEPSISAVPVEIHANDAAQQLYASLSELHADLAPHSVQAVLTLADDALMTGQVTQNSHFHDFHLT